MPATITKAQTLIEALDRALREVVSYNPNTHIAPAAVLWTDEKREWEPLLPRLRAVMPHLLTLGTFEPDARTGPAIWLKCVVARTLSGADWPTDAVPVIYLPGISRQQLRAVESCPPSLQPLAELQYRGLIFSQPNGRDWTLLAFLSSEGEGLGLDVARDAATAEAMQRALVRLADEPLARLRDHRLEAADFDGLLTPDPVRDVLLWLDADDPKPAGWDANKWSVFCTVCREQYGFDPKRDGRLVAAEKLGHRKGPWRSVWARFAEALALYPNLPDRLRQARPATTGNLFENTWEETWPQDNEASEDELRRALNALDNVLPDEAARQIADLETAHGHRRTWVWAALQQAPLAEALRHLFELARATQKPLGGTTPTQIAEAYCDTGWHADVAVLRALNSVREPQDVRAVATTVKALYAPWLAQAAEAFQAAVTQHPLPVAGKQPNAEPKPGRVILFADALRYDVGQLLREHLEAAGMAVQQDWRFVALPSLTATSKPAISPAAASIDAHSQPSGFQPQVAGSDQALTTDRLRKLLQEQGCQVLLGQDTGDSSGTGWTELGDLDRQGHKEGWKLAWRIEEVLRDLCARIRQLFEAGWREVVVVTDHGWLLLPGNLPKRNLPHYLADTRWGRCATLKDVATTELQVVPWHWNPDVRIAMAPGIGVFREGLEYAHGGLSPQECIVPIFTVSRPISTAHAAITSAVWRGLRCRITVEGDAAGLLADIRLKTADPASSIVTQAKPVEDDGQVALLVPDESHEGTAALVVLLDAEGHVVAKLPTLVGA